MFANRPRSVIADRPGRFFDWASLSPLSTVGCSAQEDSVRNAARELDAPARVRRETAELDGLREDLGALLSADNNRHEVILGRSVAEFMSVLAHGLALARESTVLLVEPFHDCVHLAWRAAAQERGFRVEVIPALSPGRSNVAAVRTRLQRPDCAWLVLTHVDHLHGEVQEVELLVELAREKGTRVILDGAQAVGRIPIDICSIAADLYLGSGRKALLGPLGTSFLVGLRDVVSDIRPIIWSTRSASLTLHGEIELADLPARLEGNLPDLAALAALRASIQLVTAASLVALRAHVSMLVPRLVSGLAASRLIPVVDPGVTNVGIVSFDLPLSVDGNGLQEQLRQRGIVVAASRDRLRISLHHANDVDDVDLLCREVGVLVKN